ncbi:transient receptor potential cation channel subfamily A member 1-like [Amphiura filiformis]|uniref:transient receptor potential cation channel subfamily A member 1-like n=1 Tax=Amphiura filiformis TaxID=82378 RepID=UPI003B2243F5
MAGVLRRLSGSTRRKSYRNVELVRLRSIYNRNAGRPILHVPHTIEEAAELCDRTCHRVAASGNLEEFTRLYEESPDRLHIRDKHGAGAMHRAVSKSRLKIMEFIIEHGGDINAVDENGNTPLHWAVKHNQSAGIDFLIQQGANTTILNEQLMAPLHLACEQDIPDAVEHLCKHHEVDIHLPGELGQTALHYCAIKDSHRAVVKLLEFKPDFCRQDLNGVYPVHAAATHASARVLDLLFKACGPLQTKVLNSVDKEGNSVLHSAVNSGSEEAVRVCLEYGARIDFQQVDKSTPVHLACSQGALEIVKLMFTIQDEERKSLFMKDLLQQTPLHKAAMFDHFHVVEYLVKEVGSDINATDKAERSPLLLATQKGGWRTVHLLLECGANFKMTDSDNRNLLHYAVLFGGSLEALGRSFFKKEDAAVLLNEPDHTGCTPMHYATREGNIKSVQGLIDLGATVNLKNKDKQSPLHFAAKYGRFNSCKRLLDSAIGPNIINETDSEGMTALHIASLKGHIKVVQLLMLRGALLHRDHRGRSPLHLAAMEGYTNTMKILLATHGHLLNCQDDDGNTALHLAAQEGRTNAVSFLLNSDSELKVNNDGYMAMDFAIATSNKEVALAVVSNERWHEVLSQKDVEGQPHILGLVELLPDVALAVLDRCEEMIQDPNNKNVYGYKYDFRYLQCPKEDQHKFNPGCPYVPLLPLNHMVQFNRIDLLSHPVCVNYLSMKWDAYGRIFHLFNLMLYVTFLCFMTSFVCWSASLKGFLAIQLKDNETCGIYNELDFQDAKMGVFQIICLWVITIFAAGSVIKEILQIIHQRKKYFTDPGNIPEWTLYVLLLIYVIPFHFDSYNWYQLPCVSVAVFLAWFNFLLYLTRFDIFGIYVVMFLEIFRTLIQVLVVFSILFIAFGLSFYILLWQEENKAFSTPLLSILRVTTALLLGELDYVNSFVEPNKDGCKVTMPYAQITQLLLCACVILLPILLMNLLIGLAVGDIAGVQRNARLKRLGMQVELHTDLEHKLPNRVLKYGEKVDYTVWASKEDSLILKFWRKIRETAGMEDDHVAERSTTAIQSEPSISTLHIDMVKQKEKLKELTHQMEKQHDLLRLIVQKMEIRSEADDQDEGEGPKDKSRYQMSELVRRTMARQTFNKVFRRTSSSVESFPKPTTPKIDE